MPLIGYNILGRLGWVPVVCGCAVVWAAQGAPSPQAQWTTTSRLLKLGEEIVFTFQVPYGVTAN
jgi:hypothetical protein